MWKEAEAARKKDAKEEVEKRVQQPLKATFGSSRSSKIPPVSPLAVVPSPFPSEGPSSPIETQIEDPSSSLKQISSIEPPQLIVNPEPQKSTVQFEQPTVVLPKITIVELPKAKPDKQQAPEAKSTLLQVQMSVSVVATVATTLAAIVHDKKQMKGDLNQMNQTLESGSKPTKKLEKAKLDLQVSQATAEEASMAKSKFLANMSHEI
ncbi:hypothetical protein L7F22_066613 [Adiantum nelumboides]|nr:hypothetical protein [Adiantum nelumboides]